MAVRVLGIDIMSYLKGDGFKQADKQAGKLGQTFQNLKEFASSGLGKIVGGYFAVSKVIEEYNKAIEAANYQLEQETKLQTTLKSQGFRIEQIENIKKYASELQKVGVIGDEVTLAGAQQLATYNLTEENLKRLLPAMQDILVQSKGLAGTGDDAIGVANMLANGLLGQTGELEEAGITLNERQKQLIAVGTQEEKVAALVEAVRMNVGEQNKEFLKTPEGKIAAVKNNIGDMYENIGMLFRESRAWGYELIGNNLPIIENFLTTLIKSSQRVIKSVIDSTKAVYRVFSSVPSEVKTTIALITGFFTVSAFPIVAAVVAVEDLITAFEGGESVIKNIYNTTMSFLGINTTFEETIESVKALWKAFEEANGVKITLEVIQGSIEAIANAIKAIIGGIKLVTGSIGLFANGTSRIIKAMFSNEYSLQDANRENALDFDDGLGKLVKSGKSEFINSSSNLIGGVKKRYDNISKLYNDGQRKTVKDIPTVSAKESTINYEPSDITINVNGSVSEDLVMQIKDTIAKEREGELMILKQQIGGRLSNA